MKSCPGSRQRKQISILPQAKVRISILRKSPSPFSAIAFNGWYLVIMAEGMGVRTEAASNKHKELAFCLEPQFQRQDIDPEWGYCAKQVAETVCASGSGGLLQRLALTGVDVVRLDWTVDMAEGRRRLGKDVAVQGNVDPGVLFGSKVFITNRINDVVRKTGKGSRTKLVGQ
ncbi:unnamed protein product [Linum trigynum]|uniref:Uroporphyrinogen decarboxylase (URO-D) domain-containing protein n=1 Tax=Linum trigynum TaxID=586398 RepID=A0AAV2FXK6_9ROSI